MQNKTPAGFFVRLCAYIIDRAMFFAVFLVFRLIGGITALIMGAGAPKAVIFEFTLTDIISAVLIWVYFVCFTYTNGATLGKYLMNICVESTEPERKPTFIEILIRETVGRFLSSLLFIGYIMIGIDENKRGLHDRICDTRVVYATPRPKPARESNDSYIHTGYYTGYTEPNDSESAEWREKETETKDSYGSNNFYSSINTYDTQTTESTDEKNNEEN